MSQFPTPNDRPNTNGQKSSLGKGGRSGLRALSDGVRAYFEQHQVPAVVGKVGWRSRFRVDNQGPSGASRVIFIPGEYDGTIAPKTLKAGELGKGRKQHDFARELAWWRKISTVSIWAKDLELPDDDEAQIEATETLLEWTIRGMHLAVDPVSNVPVGLADVILKDSIWVKPPGEMAFGLELLVTFEHESALFDVPEDLAYPLGIVSRDSVT